MSIGDSLYRETSATKGTHDLPDPRMTAVLALPGIQQAGAGSFRFNLRFLMLLIAAISAWLAILRTSPHIGISIIIVSMPAYLGLSLGRTMAVGRKLPMPGQWLMGGIGLAMAVHGTWPVKGGLFVCGTCVPDSHAVFGCGWPAGFLYVNWLHPSSFAFMPDVLALDVLVCSALLYFSLRLIARWQHIWHRTVAESVRLLASLLIAPTVLLLLLRTNDLLDGVLLIALIGPMAVGIVCVLDDAARSRASWHDKADGD